MSPSYIHIVESNSSMKSVSQQVKHEIKNKDENQVLLMTSINDPRHPYHMGPAFRVARVGTIHHLLNLLAINSTLFWEIKDCVTELL